MIILALLLGCSPATCVRTEVQTYDCGYFIYTGNTPMWMPAQCRGPVCVEWEQ